MAAHAEQLFAALSDPEIYRFVPQDPPSLATLTARYERTATGPTSERERWWNWVVFVRGADELAIGTIEVSIEASQNSASLAYTFGRAFWGAGYANESCSAALAYVRSSTNVTRINAEIDTRNTRSIALVERLGFVRTETIPNADFFKGATSDELAYERELRD